MTSIVTQQSIESLVDKWLKDEENGIEFPVDFDIAWQLAGYSRKDVAKRKLLESGYFDETQFHISAEMVNRSQGGGRKVEIIKLTCDAFKEFCMLSKSETGKITRKYFIECEKKWKLVKQVNPSFSQEIEFLHAQERILDKQLKLRELDNTMLLLHGKQVTLALRGYDQAIVEVEKPTLEVIDKRSGDRREGMTTKQLNEYLQQQTGNSFKSGSQVKQILEKEAPELLDIVQRPVNQDWVLKENVEKAIEVLKRRQPKQMLLGE